MLTITLPDGAERQVEEGTLPRDVVASIGSRLLRDAVAVQVDGDVVDLITPLRKGGAFKVLTAKDQQSLDVLRHSSSDLVSERGRRRFSDVFDVASRLADGLDEARAAIAETLDAYRGAEARQATEVSKVLTVYAVTTGPRNPSWVSGREPR